MTAKRIKVSHALIKRSKTNNNDFAKQIFRIASMEGTSPALIVDKYVLIDEAFKSYERSGFNLLKTYKGKRLYYQTFSIKLETLNEVAEFINDLPYAHQIERYEKPTTNTILEK